jgi:hypothetical protein
MQLWHAGEDAWEAIPAPAQVELEGGDAVLFLSTATVSFANAGTEPVELIGWLLSGDRPDSPMYPPEWKTDVIAGSSDAGISLAGGSGVLRVRQVVLPPASLLPLPPLALSQLGVTLSGPAGTPGASTIDNRDDGQIVNPGTEPVTAFVVTLEPEEAASGAGDEQASRKNWREPHVQASSVGRGTR